MYVHVVCQETITDEKNNAYSYIPIQRIHTFKRKLITQTFI